MSCRRAFESDLPAFFSEPARPEHADFRAHYPLCRECAGEVAAWTELEASLHGFGVAHPEPAALLRFEERAADLAPPDRARIEAHLVRCASCRDELSSLRAFPFADVAAKGGRSHRTRPPARRSRIARVRSVVLHPVFAYAVVALLAWPAAQSLLAPDARDSLIVGAAESPAPATDVASLDKLARREKLLAEPLEPPELVRSARAASRQMRPEAKSEAPLVAPAPAQTQSPVAKFEVEKLPAESERLQVLQKRGPAYGLAADSPAPMPPPAERASRVLEEVRARAAGITATLESDAARAPARLRIELPPELRAEREVLVRVRDSARLRELRERVPPTPGADWIEIALPEDWPAAASFEVELRGASSAGDPERVFRQTLTR